MTQEEIIEMAIQGHASTRDAIRWAIKQEREACAEICDKHHKNPVHYTAPSEAKLIGVYIRAREKL